MILCISEILISEILTCTNSLAYSPDGIQEFKMRFVRTEVLESWLFYRQIFQDFAAIATKFLRFINLNS